MINFLNTLLYFKISRNTINENHYSRRQEYTNIIVLFFMQDLAYKIHERQIHDCKSDFKIA